MVERSAWWLLPYLLLMLLMLHAMMEFSVSLLTRRPDRQRRPVPAGELRRRLLSLDDPDWPVPLTEGGDCDLEVHWQRRERRRRGSMVTGGGAEARTRLLLDGSRSELRLHGLSRSYGYHLGVSRWLPRVGGHASVDAGPPGHTMVDEIGRMALRAGWTVRPVLWWFQATHRGFRMVERLRLGPGRWPARRFWGVLYPVSFIAALGYLVAVVGPLEPGQWLLLVGVSVAWWGVWGILILALARRR